MALITCRNVTLSYEGNIVLSELSFTVNSGDYLCIVGENGSGKSTLVKAMLSLKSLEKGDIQTDDGLLRREIGYLPQQTAVQKDFPASVWEVVLSGCLNNRGLRPFYSNAEKESARSNMEKLEIENLKYRCYRELSSGQQQRALLARALCATKKLILLDEPVSGLDPVVTGELYRLIKQINSEGVTVVMVSHDVESAVKYASHILHLRNNKASFFGTVADYTESGAGKYFLGGARNV